MQSSNGQSETVTENKTPANSTASEAEALPEYQPRAARRNAMGQRVAPEKRETRQDAKETSTDDEAPQPERLSLSELFDETGNVTDDDSESKDDKVVVDHIEKLTKRLGLTPEQAYAIRVPMPDGAESLTIGELKDKVKDVVNLETRETQFDQRRSRQEGDLLRAQTEMRSLLAMLPKDAISPEMVERVRKQHDAKMGQERRLTLQVIPEWDDESTRETEIQSMSDFLQEHGFDDSFIATIVDHRALRFIRTMWQRDARIKKALANVKDTKRTGAPLGQRTSGKPSRAAAKPGNTVPRRDRVLPDQRAKIMDLLNRNET